MVIRGATQIWEPVQTAEKAKSFPDNNIPTKLAQIRALAVVFKIQMTKEEVIVCPFGKENSGVM